MKTAEDQLQRMEALVRRMASNDGACFVMDYKDEACAIVAEIDLANGPQTDEEWARKIVREQDHNVYDASLEIAHKAIANSRPLAMAEQRKYSFEGISTVGTTYENVAKYPSFAVGNFHYNNYSTDNRNER